MLFDSDHGFERRQEAQRRQQEEEAAQDVLPLACTRHDVAAWTAAAGEEGQHRVVLLDLRDKEELEYDPPLRGAISLPASLLARGLKLDEDVWQQSAGLPSLSAADRVVVYSNPEELSQCAGAVRTLLSHDLKSVHYFLGGAREWNKYNNAQHEPVEFVELPL